MKKAEAILIIIALLTFTLNLLFLVPYMTIVFVLSLFALSIIYFLGRLSVFKSEGQHVLVPIVAGLALSIATIGVLFKVQSWAFADFYIKAACIGLLVTGVIMAVMYSQTKTYNATIAKRLVAYACICGILYFLPQFAIINVKYRNQPAYRDALKNSINHPGDTALYYKANAERIKMEKDN